MSNLKPKQENKEIELKFYSTLAVVQPLLEYSEKVETIEQYYTELGIETETRIRQSEEKEKTTYTVTKKKGSGLVREEIEHTITKEEYDKLKETVNHLTPIRKERHTVSILGYKTEIDIYLDQLDCLVVLEVEFKNENEIDLFKQTTNDIGLFYNDITYQNEYKNKNIWKKINNLQ